MARSEPKPWRKYYNPEKRQKKREEQRRLQQQKQKRDLTDAEKQAVEYYVSGDGMYLNDYLRQRNYYANGANEGDITESDRQIIEDLTSATGTPLGEPMHLYRCVDATALFPNMTEQDYWNYETIMNNGDRRIAAQLLQQLERSKTKIENDLKRVFVDKGFVSTTTDYDTAKDWYGFTGADMPIVLDITTPAQTKGLNLSKSMPELEERMEQHEVLLGRGQTFTTDGMGWKNGLIHVKLRVN